MQEDWTFKDPPVANIPVIQWLYKVLYLVINAMSVYWWWTPKAEGSKGKRKRGKKTIQELAEEVLKESEKTGMEQMDEVDVEVDGDNWTLADDETGMGEYEVVLTVLSIGNLNSIPSTGNLNSIPSTGNLGTMPGGKF